MILGINITPSEGEQSVKSYQCTEFVSRFFGINSKGYLEVTNKRLLFQALGQNIRGWSVIHKEVSISEVSDIKIYKGSTFNLLLFIAGILLDLFVSTVVYRGVGSFTSDGFGMFFAIGAFAYGAYLVYIWCKKQAFSLIINTKGGTGNVVYLAGISPFNTGNSAASRALIYTKPGADTEIMLREIGAVILDVQNLGDYAIEKWKPSVV
ncbi:hypothetical protein [Dyadobacter psychrotolerans]|uniref:Uncharacterized protein n=1 Tax=Dyadobacter psychrotolerans TaxID=2541721 RepID=A0A4R5DVE4_9BACT|nr:hypothetical protein [Dyadobacter psychrotolerans]TDE15205.1 hypothetical protein E0F88_11815 [Dyadobacter psychrotolerans]